MRKSSDLVCRYIMASISFKREDWNAIDPVRDVKFLAEAILKEEERRANAPGPAVKNDLTPELVAKLLPPEMREPIHGRNSTKIPMLHIIMRTYTSTYLDNPERTWEEFAHIRRYLMMHALYNGLRTQLVDLAAVSLITAETPELVLALIRRTNDGEFSKMPEYKNFPISFAAAEIICYFMHTQCSAYTIFTEKFFRDMPGCPQEIVRMMYTRPWYERFAAVRVFGFASTHPTACLWLLKHPKALTSILRYSHQTGPIVERHVQKDKLTNSEDYFKPACRTNTKKEAYIKTTRVMAGYAAVMSVLAFSNMTHHFGNNFEDFLVLRRVVYESEVIQNFHTVARNTMRWLTPGRFTSGFLQGVYRCLEMDRTTKLLFLDDFEFFRRHKISAGWDSLKYFNHQVFHTSHVTFLLCHALSAKYLIGSNWAAGIIAYVLDNCPDSISRPIIEVCGYELLDLAHLLKAKEPVDLSIQSVILQALLRYAGFSHKVWDKGDSYTSELKPVKKIPEFCVEAALYCRRATLEESLPLTEKQHRVKMADEKKEAGNTLFKKGKFREAIELYTEALALCPLSARSKQAIYYSNRAECFLRVNEAERAVHDCNRALCLDRSKKVKIQWRRSRAYQRMDLDYPAWLDMYCIRDEWKSDKEDTSGVDFSELEEALRDKVCLVEKEQTIDLERKAVDYL